MIADQPWGRIGRGRCLPDGTYHTRCLHGMVLSVFREREPLPNGRSRWQWRVAIDGQEHGVFHTLKGAKYSAEKIADRLTSEKQSI